MECLFHSFIRHQYHIHTHTHAHTRDMWHDFMHRHNMTHWHQYHFLDSILCMTHSYTHTPWLVHIQTLHDAVTHRDTTWPIHTCDTTRLIHVSMVSVTHYYRLHYSLLCMTHSCTHTTWVTHTQRHYMTHTHTHTQREKERERHATWLIHTRDSFVYTHDMSHSFTETRYDLFTHVTHSYTHTTWLTHTQRHDMTHSHTDTSEWVIFFFLCIFIYVYIYIILPGLFRMKKGTTLMCDMTHSYEVRHWCGWMSECGWISEYGWIGDAWHWCGWMSEWMGA